MNDVNVVLVEAEEGKVMYDAFELLLRPSLLTLLFYDLS